MIRPQNRSPRRALPRLHPLAACLASALLMQGSALAAGIGSRGVLHTGGPGVASVHPRANLAVNSCDDSGSGSLRSAVAGAASGDVIDLGSLTCPAITLTSGAIVIGSGIANLTINGPGQSALSISGNDASRIFEQQGSGMLSLSGLTLTHGRAADNGGCVLANGSLTLTGVTFSTCVAGAAEVAGTAGGGAFVLGNATLSDSHFSDNTVDGNLRVRGGGLFVGGLLSATDSTFTNNSAHSHTVSGGNSFQNMVEGGGIDALGATTIVGSTISGNQALSDSYEVFGGGLNVGSHPDYATASLDLSQSVVSGNSNQSNCGVCAPQGGGIAVTGVASLDKVTLSDNTVGSPGHYGGAGGLRVFLGPNADIQDSTISGNHADSAGGGMIGPESGVVSLAGSSVSGNFAGNQGGTDEGGGGILCLGCAVQLSNSTVSGNTAEADGGGIGIRYGEYAPVPTTVSNSTISGNTGAEGGGIMLNGGNAQFSNSTIAFNQASTRGAGISASEYSYSIELQSTIVASNTTGSAAGNVWAFPDTISGSHNLIPNPSGPAAMPPDTLTGDPLLLPLAANGGPTMTHALRPGSIAVDAGANPDGLDFDQRGSRYRRAFGAAADIGAFERSPTTSSRPPVRK